MNIAAFIARCDAYCEAEERSRVWLSKRLLDDTYRLDKLAKGEVDIGVKRLERAVDDLAALEADAAAARRTSTEAGAAA
jgi:hypothetical protein